MRNYYRSLIATSISSVARYYDTIYQYVPLANDPGTIFSLIDCQEKHTVLELNKFPDITSEKSIRSAIFLNGNFNHHNDIQELLSSLKCKISRTSRVIVLLYNSYFRWLYQLVNFLGIRKGEIPSTFLTRADVHNVAELAGFDVVQIKPVVHCPFRLFGLGSLINAVLPAFPIFKWFGLASIITLRPIIKDESSPSLSIIIPARNEQGNIEDAIARMPKFQGQNPEIIFVEGHSSDDTWKEILRVQNKYKDLFVIKAFQQTGEGKNNAVRLGFQEASGDLFTILDADLTMPPELLTRFYEAYCEGLGDFINGSRLLYPMEGGAMQFLNRLGNVFFAKVLSNILDTRLTDTLCGTKMLCQHDYKRIMRWRNDFGNFDPFGDFELLFSAASLGLGVANIPIRYRSRQYGATNISRFSHGFLLFKMTAIGFFKIKLGKFL